MTGELTDGSGAIPSGDPESSVDEHGMNSGELVVAIEATADVRQDKTRRYLKEVR